MLVSRISFTFFIVFGLSGCVLKPGGGGESVAGGLDIPARFDASQAPVPEVASGLRDLFPSPSLRADIDRALQQNPDLKASAARLREAGFNTRQTRAGLFPSLTANAGASRAQSNSAGAGFDVGSFIAERYTATLDARWELDVWGRVRAGVTAATRDLAAAAADDAAARQSIAAQVAQAHFALAGAEKLTDLAERRYRSFDSTLSLVDRRFEGGLSTLGDVELARTDVETARSQIAERKDSRDQAARQLAALMGEYPKADRRGRGFPSSVRSVPAGVPSSLLRQRPDVDAAYQRLRASNARIDVAHAALFPSFALTASAGRQSARLSDLARSNFDIWAVAGNLSAPIFAAGSLRDEVRASGARSEQALANYQSTVLNALREVEDALGSDRYLAQRESATRSALEAAKRAEERVRQSYERGLVEILTLLDAQRRAFAAEEALISIQTLRYQNRVALALALGKAV